MDTPEKTDQEKLNPRFRVLEIGTRHLREITLWPMSFGDQLKLKDIIVAAGQEFFTTILPKKLEDAEEAKAAGIDNIVQDVETMEYIKFFIEQIEKNLSAVLKLAVDDTEDPEKILSEADNVQVSEISTIIFDNNFWEASKNVRSLVNKVKETFQLTRQEPQSVDGTDIN